MNGLLIRAMAPEDVPELVRGEARVEESPWSRQDFLDCFGEGYVALVGEVAGEIVSWGVLRTVLDEAELHIIGVMPEWQRRGIGEATCAALLDKMREAGVTRCFLEVRESNLRAQRLYRKLGFTVVGLRKDYYRSGAQRENAVIMRYERNE